MKFDKELFCYEVVYSRSDELDDGDDITERFGTDTEAVERARYLSSISFYKDIRVYAIYGLHW